MTNGHRTLIALATIMAFVTASCTPSDQQDSTASTGSTSTTVAATTTTVAPGLEPTELSYGFAADTLWTHDTNYHITVVSTLDLSGLLDDESTITTDVDGITRTLAFPTDEPGTHEVVQDFLLDSGYLEIVGNGTTVGQDITNEQRSEWRDLAATAIVLDSLGTTTGDRTGAPGTTMRPSPTDPLTAYGPIFIAEPVDEGDEWSFTLEDEQMGPVPTTATIVGEIETDAGYRFEIEYSASAVDLPVTVDAANLPDDPTLGMDLLGMLTLFDTVEITFEEFEITGRGVFDPERGVMDELETTLTSLLAMRMTTEGEELTGSIEIEIAAEYTLAEIEEATTFETEAILDQYVVDPYDLAAERNVSLPFLMDLPDIDEISAITDVLFSLGSPFAGFSILEVYTDEGEAVAVVMTNGGEFRGYPLLAKEAGWVLAESEPREVTISGRSAWRVEIDGQDWLLWNDDQFTYVAIGELPAATAVIAAHMDAPAPYFWQAGDCFDFTDFDGEVPFSTFGSYGVTHCRAPHQYEVIHTEILEDGADDPFPSDLDERRNRTCGERFFEHVGAYPLDSEVKMITYQPNPDEWEKGARYISCVVYRDGDDAPVQVDRRLQGMGATIPVVLAPGDCLAGTWVVDCDDPHDAEITSVETYDAALDADYPDLVDLYDELGETCESVLDGYGATDGPAELNVWVVTDIPLGWATGVRSYHCAVYPTIDDVAVSTVGSVREDWEIAPDQVDT